MDTTQVAEAIGTTPRSLRQFLRSTYSTFVPVGSGSRYDFKESELPTIEKRFTEWKGDGKPRPNVDRKPKSSPASDRSREDLQRVRDEQEWNEEGPVVLEDIRDPRVRARVKRAAALAEADLMQRLLAVGLHVYQLGDRKSA